MAVRECAHEHDVYFYADDAELCTSVIDFAKRGLEQGCPVIIIATEEHSRKVCAGLATAGLEPKLSVASELLQVLDARQMLDKIMRGTRPDPEAFRAHAFGLLSHVARTFPGRRVLAFGEMVDLLWREGNQRGAILLEELWNELQRELDFELLCAYCIGNFYRSPRGMAEVARCHGGVHLSPMREASASESVEPQRVNGANGHAANGHAANGHAAHLAPEVPRDAEARHRELVEAALRGALRELTKQEMTLRENERRLRSIADALPALVAFIDATGHYRFANEAYENWFGLPRRQILGRHMREVLGERAYAKLDPHVRAVVSGNAACVQERVPYQSGGERFIDARYVPQFNSDGSVAGFVALVSDITEKRRVAAAREATLLRNERLMKVTAAMAEALEVEQVFEAVVDRVALALSAASAALWLVDDSGKNLRLVRSTGYTEATQRKLALIPFDQAPAIPVVDAVVRGMPVWIESQAELVKAYPAVARMVTKGSDYGIACLPLLFQGQARGVVGFTFDDRRLEDKDEHDFLLLVARYSSQAVERLRLLETERRSRAQSEASAERLALLGRASRALAEVSRQPEAIFEAVSAQLTDGFADICALTLEAAETGQARLSLQRSKSVEQPPGPAHGHSSALRIGGDIVGSLSLTRFGAQPFDLSDQQLLEDLADRVSMAISASRLSEAGEQARARAELLYELAAEVIHAKTLEQVFEAALGGIERALGASRCSILVCDSDGVMRFRAWRGLSEHYRRSVEGHSPWDPAHPRPEPIVVEDVHADEQLSAFGALFTSEGIGALAFIPLIWHRQLIGKFMVYYPSRRALSAAEIELGGAIANHLATAVGRFSALGELQQTIHFNEVFTGMLGHDLRNPLGAIMAAAQVAERKNEAEALKRPLSRILSSGARMARMIDQLLDFTRVRVGAGIPIEAASTDLLPIVRHALEEVSLAHPDWQLRFSDAVGDTSGSWDADRISQVFSNLLGNAVQHGSIEHGVTIHVDGSQSHGISVSVHNQGSVPASILPSLFEPMPGGDRRRERARGLGLGLYISREILRAHGGSINVETDDENGTTFKVWLPRTVGARAHGTMNR